MIIVAEYKNGQKRFYNIDAKKNPFDFLRCVNIVQLVAYHGRHNRSSSIHSINLDLFVDIDLSCQKMCLHYSISR